MGDEGSKKFTQFGVKMVAIRGVLGILLQGEFGILFFNVLFVLVCRQQKNWKFEEGWKRCPKGTTFRDFLTPSSG
jgi:hypothetical protein